MTTGSTNKLQAPTCISVHLITPIQEVHAVLLRRFCVSSMYHAQCNVSMAGYVLVDLSIHCSSCITVMWDIMTDGSNTAVCYVNVKLVRQ